MIKWFYKRLINKLNLPANQLEELKNKLTPDHICKGPLVQGNKNCPETTALAVKMGRDKFKDNAGVRKLLNENGINNFELLIFYILFDIPSLMSEKFFETALGEMKKGLDELILEKT